MPGVLENSVEDQNKPKPQIAPEDGADAGPDWGPRGMAPVSFAGGLSFENISHGFDRGDILNDINLELGVGEIICLLGPSGCGKTTLLRIGAGVERPRQGRVLLDGRMVSGPGVFVPPEQRAVGLMFQDFALFPHLTILENILFGLKKLPREQALTEARGALARVGMHAFEGVYPHMLSGGEQQRIALARAIAPRPAVLLMDEPFSGLDRRLRSVVRDETLGVLKDTRASALMVTHDPEEALGMADRIALMRSGRLLQLGAPEELYSAPASASVARMFSHCNELTARVSGKYVETALGKIAAPKLKTGDEAVVLLRPKAFRPTNAKNGVAVQVKSARFMGSATLVELLIEGLDHPLVADFAPETPCSPGKEMRVALDKSQIFVFAKDGGAANQH